MFYRIQVPTPPGLGAALELAVSNHFYHPSLAKTKTPGIKMEKAGDTMEKNGEKEKLKLRIILFLY